MTKAFFMTGFLLDFFIFISPNWIQIMLNPAVPQPGLGKTGFKDFRP